MKDIVIFDLDGTLSDGRHRLHLLPKENPHLPRSWDEFNKAAIDDAPIEDNIELLDSLISLYEVVILTGRNEVVRDITEAWLKRNDVPYSQLIMRPYDDSRKDIHFKEEIVKQIGVENILCAFDDLPHVARHLRSLGVTTHLVTEYEEAGRVDLQSHGDE